MVAALDQNRLGDAPSIPDTDIDESYLSLNVEGFREALTDDWGRINALNEIRRVSGELVAAGIKSIQFGESARKGDTLFLGIRELERTRFVAFLKSIGIDVPDTDMGDELRASLQRREARRQARENERLVRQRGHVARYSVRKEISGAGKYDIEFINGEKTQFVVLDEEGTRTLYVGRISEEATSKGFLVEIYKARLIVNTNGEMVYKGPAATVFKGKVRDILEGVGGED